MYLAYLSLKSRHRLNASPNDDPLASNNHHKVFYCQTIMEKARLGQSDCVLTRTLNSGGTLNLKLTNRPTRLGGP